MTHLWDLRQGKIQYIMREICGVECKQQINPKLISKLISCHGLYKDVSTAVCI